MERKKILMLLSNPFMVDPRVSREAKSLVDYGHEVTVIVWDRKGDYPSEDIIDGIRIIRIHNNLLMKIMPNDLFRNPLWWRRAYKKGLELYKSGQFKFDVVHCHDLDTLQSGVWLKKKLGLKLIYDAHEIFGYMIARDMPKFIVGVALRMEKRLVKKVNRVITVNEPLRDYFRSISNTPITVVMNCNDLVSQEYIPPRNDAFTVCYIGVLTKSRMFPEIVDILGKIKGVRFVIAGKKENLYAEVKERCEKYDTVEFLGAIPFCDVIQKTLEAHIVACMINPKDLNNRIGIANKQFEAMACGRPILCTKETYSGAMTDELKCGLSIDYDKDALHNAILKLRDDPELCEEFGRTGLKAAKEKYNWNKQAEKLLKVYETRK
ncbi:Glycosyltransferase involved in cell wall bisynthesis [Methanophagales archaeon]|nr:Glycosyltransferase involved in cell wall bisynthesis [Methanophagales archaeon]